MVLPTDYHWALRGWLHSHRITADEAGGVLIIRNLDRLLRLSGSARRLTADERALIKEARARHKAEDAHSRTEVGDWMRLLRTRVEAYPTLPADHEFAQLLSTVAKALTTELDYQAAGEELATRVRALLDGVCEALDAVDVPARPYEGLGIVFGNEILHAMVCTSETARLYELMQADGFSAKPDWDAPTFRKKSWPAPQP